MDCHGAVRLAMTHWWALAPSRVVAPLRRRPRPVIAYMDAPCLANCFVTLCSIGEVATVHSDFDVLFALSQMGLAGRIPSEVVHSKCVAMTGLFRPSV